MMKVLHTSDWHLGIYLHNMPLYSQQQKFLDELKEIIKEESIDALIVAGDIFDSSVSSSEAIELYDSAITGICKNMGVKTFIIAGNHDGAARLSSMNTLLEKSGLYVSGKIERDIKPVSLDSADIYLIPFFNIDKVRSLYPEEEIKTYENAMKTVCDNIRKNADKEKFNIIVSHAFVSGAEISESDRSAMCGGANMVSADVFDGFSYVALGHLHKGQKIRENVYYSGSPLKYSFSEANHRKCVNILDTKTGEITQREITAGKSLKIIKGTYEEITKVTQPCDDYLKIEITDKIIGMDTLMLLREIYPNLLCVTGKSAEITDEIKTLSVSELENLTPEETVLHFFSEMFDENPEKEYVDEFLSLLEKAENGGDLS